MNRRELAAAYLLGELDGADREDVDRRLAADAGLRAEVEAMRPLLGTLAGLPAEAWPEEADTRAATTAPPARRRRWTLRPAVAIAAVLVAAALGAGLGAFLAGGDGKPSTQAPAIVLRPLEPTAGETATVAMPRPGEMVLRARGLPRRRAGSTTSCG